jgi:hypothetical protein
MSERRQNVANWETETSLQGGRTYPSANLLAARESFIGTIRDLACCNGDNRHVEDDEMEKQAKFARQKTIGPLTTSGAVEAVRSNGESPAAPQSGDIGGAPALAGQGDSPVERIRERAYHLWLESGQVDGKDEEHWRTAEEEIQAHPGSQGPAQAR